MVLARARNCGRFPGILLAGGDWNNARNAGPGYRIAHHGPTSSNRKIGARLEPRNSVVEVNAGRQHDHRNAVARTTQLVEHREAVFARHVDVEHEQVKLAGLRERESIGTIGRDLRREACGPQDKEGGRLI